MTFPTSPNLSLCSSHHDDVTVAEAGAAEMLGTVDNSTSKGPVFQVQLAAGSIGNERGLWMGEDNAGKERREVG